MDFQIKFKSSADTTGAKQTADSIKAVNDAAKQSKAPLEQAAEATKGLAGQKKVLKETIQELSHSIPGVGSLLLLLKNPVTILAGAIGVLVAAWRNYMQSLDELESKLGVQEAAARSMRAMKSAASDAAAELKAFSEHLGTIGQKGDDAATRVNKVVEAMRKVEQMQAEKRSAEEALALAGVTEQEKRGLITPGDAIRARAAIKETFAARAEAARIKQLEDEQEAKKEALRNTMEKTARAEAAHPGAVAEAVAAERAAKAAPDQEKADLEFIGGQKTKADDRLKSLRNSLDGYQMKLLEQMAAIAPEGSAAAGAPAAFRKELEAQIDQTERDLELLARQEQSVIDRRKSTEKEAVTKRKHADDLKKEIETGRDASGKLFEEVEAGDRGIRTFREHRSNVRTMEERARRIESDADADAADEQERQSRQFQRGTRRSFGMNDGGSGVGSVVNAVNENGDATLAALAAVEAALREKTRQVETASARLRLEASREA